MSHSHPQFPRSTLVYARNAWVLATSQYLRMPGSFGMLFTRCNQGKLASFQQVSSPNSQDNFQICCVDMYLVRFLANFAGFRMFLWILRDFACFCEFRGISHVFVNFAGFRGFTWNSQLRDCAEYQKPWPILVPILI